MPGASDPWDAVRRRVAQQAHYLRNPLDPAPGICYVCRGPAKAGWSRCYTCEQHLTAAQSSLADAVVPISYAVKRTQHAHALAAYKSTPSREIQTNLLDLLMLFITDHHQCVARAAHIDQWSHLAVVPSTRGRPGEHPLRTLIGNRFLLPWIHLTATGISSEPRAFHSDRFTVHTPTEDLSDARVLLFEDTWTTGARVQSAAYAIKKAGAARVAVVVLGRHVNPDFGPWQPILQSIADRPYRPDLCAVHLSEED